VTHSLLTVKLLPVWFKQPSVV